MAVLPLCRQCHRCCNLFMPDVRTKENHFCIGRVEKKELAGTQRELEIQVLCWYTLGDFTFWLFWLDALFSPIILPQNQIHIGLDEHWTVSEIWPIGHSKLYKTADGRDLGFVGPFDLETPKTPTLEPNMKRIGSSVAEIWPFEIFQAATLDLVQPETAPFDPPTSKTPL